MPQCATASSSSVRADGETASGTRASARSRSASDRPRPRSLRNVNRRRSSSANRTGSAASSSSASASSANARPRCGSRGVTGGGRRLFQHPHVVGADLRRGVRDLLPQLEDPVEEHQPLGVRDRVRGLHRACHDGERARRVMRRVPVVRLLDVRPARRDERRVGVDRPGEPGVHGGVLARQQVRVHGLLDQRVPERVAVSRSSPARSPPQRGGARRCSLPASSPVTWASSASLVTPLPALATRSTSCVSSGSRRTACSSRSASESGTSVAAVRAGAAAPR